MSTKTKKKSKSKEPKKSKAEVRQEQITKVITPLREDGNELFHTLDEQPWARTQVKGSNFVKDHFENLEIKKNGKFQRLLERDFHKLFGVMPPKKLISDMLRELEGKACFDGPEHNVALRVAEHGGNYYLDLSDPEWRCVEITPYGGWNVISNPPVRFRRSEGMSSLPMPVHDGSISELFEFINVEECERVLLLAWLIAAYQPTGPYPLLALHGQQGSAKSFTQTVLRKLVDPSKAPLCSAPRNERDLVIAASNAHLLDFDNFSAIPIWLSDAMSKLITGGGFRTRQLYTDRKEVIFSGSRPMMLNGIEDIAERADLLSRMLVLHLPEISDGTYRTEKYLWKKFDEAGPRILGALLDAVCSALRRINDGKEEVDSRMADFTVWAVAAEEALGFESGAFLIAYKANNKEQKLHALEMETAASALGKFINSYERSETHAVWTGTCSEVVQQLNKIVVPELRGPKWPKSGSAMRGIIIRAIPNLSAMGISVEFLQRKAGQRLVRISRHNLQNAQEFAKKPVTSSHRHRAAEAVGVSGKAELEIVRK